MRDLVERLLASDEPPIHYSVRVNVLGEDPENSTVHGLLGLEAYRLKLTGDGLSLPGGAVG